MLALVVGGFVVLSKTHQPKIAVGLITKWSTDLEAPFKWSTGPETPFTIWVTNTTGSPIQLQLPQVDYVGRDGVARCSRNPLGSKVFDIMWKDVEPPMNGELTVQPSMVTQLEFNVPSDTQKVRVLVIYSVKRSGLGKRLGQGISKLPLKYFPQRLYAWLAKNGLTDPPYAYLEASPWMLNPALQRTEASRSAELPSRSPMAAGFRR
jgi:hypothetical protein